MHDHNTCDVPPTSVVAFRDARWNTRWLIVGLAVLLVWRSASFIDREWLFQFPAWQLLIVIGLVPQTFLLVFPILTRNPNHRSTFGVPAGTSVLREFGIAIPIVIAVVVGLATASYLVERFSPGTSLAPDAVSDAFRLTSTQFYLVLLFAFTFAPIAEEVFFRGFLYNALCARMPLAAAGIVQSLVFGFTHFYGVEVATILSVVGLLLTAVYQWRKTLITPIFVHAGINLIAALGALFAMVNYPNGPMLGVVGDPKASQCVIRQVRPDSAAEKAGLQVGDVILSLNAEPIRDVPHLQRTVAKYRPGDVVVVTINRSGTVLKVNVELQKRSDFQPKAPDDKLTNRPEQNDP